MNMLRSLTLTFTLGLSLCVQAQERKLTLEEAVLKQRNVLAPKRLAQLQWTSDPNYYSRVDDKPEPVLLRGDVRKPGKEESVLTLSALNKELRRLSMDTLSRFPAHQWTDAGKLRFELQQKILEWGTDNRQLALLDSITLPEGAEVPERNSRDQVAYVFEGNIWIEVSHRTTQVTRDGSSDLVYGKTVHREEFGIDKGLFWSPKGNKLAFYRMDQSMVSDYPIVDFSEKPAKDKPIKYPFAGSKSHEVTVGIYDVKSGKTIYLQTEGPAEQYLTNIAWSPDERFVYVAIVNRAQDHMELIRYDAESGKTDRKLFEEHDPRYTEPLHPVQFVNDENGRFVWQSRSDGWNHLYLYNDKGELIRQLTKGEWEVSEFNGFDPKGRFAFFHRTANTGLNREFCRVNLSTGEVNVLSTGEGVSTCILNKDRSFYLSTFSSPAVPRIQKIAGTDGRTNHTLLTAPNPLSEYAIGKTRVFSIKADDGTPLWCRMVLPPNFDSTKTYPVIVYLYGGPHLQLITNTWLTGADLWYHYMAQKGYIVFSLDNRGSSNRGKAFEQATFRKLGDVEMKDQIAGVNYLRTLPYVDKNKLGVHGWSFGGFMTTSLMTRYPGIFKVAVAGGPVIDWSYYEVMYTERYMDTPEENEAGYKNSSLLNYVDQLNGRLMLIHGTNDDVVVWQHSLMYLKKAISKGVQLDYMVYPGHAHNVTGKDRVHLMEKITRYFDDFLK